MEFTNKMIALHRMRNKYFRYHYQHLSVSNFGNFHFILKRISSAFVWYKNHQNRIQIDIVNGTRHSMPCGHLDTTYSLSLIPKDGIDESI